MGSQQLVEALVPEEATREEGARRHSRVQRSRPVVLRETCNVTSENICRILTCIVLLFRDVIYFICGCQWYLQYTAALRE